VSASVNLPLHKCRSSLLAPAHRGGPGKDGRKMVVVVVVVVVHCNHYEHQVDKVDRHSDSA